MAHLAGALGAPTWVLLRQAPDWRWGLHAETSSEYPFVHFFRKTRAGDWTSAIEPLCHALSEYLKSQSLVLR